MAGNIAREAIRLGMQAAKGIGNNMPKSTPRNLVGTAAKVEPAASSIQASMASTSAKSGDGGLRSFAKPLPNNHVVEQKQLAEKLKAARSSARNSSKRGPGKPPKNVGTTTSELGKLKRPSTTPKNYDKGHSEKWRRRSNTGSSNR